MDIINYFDTDITGKKQTPQNGGIVKAIQNAQFLRKGSNVGRIAVWHMTSTLNTPEDFRVQYHTIFSDHRYQHEWSNIHELL